MLKCIFQTLFDKAGYFHTKTYNKNTLEAHIDKTNSELKKKYSKEINLISLDILQINVGGHSWNDERIYNLCKQPFSLEAIPKISHFLGSHISGILGKYKKVLILDLDNTLWGGEVGDLGMENIILNRETDQGESYINFQIYIKELHRSGIILAVCSKNSAEVVKEVFVKHPDMVLRLEDISCFVANFKDKASNISFIKEFLNIGFENMVFKT